MMFPLLQVQKSQSHSIATTFGGLVGPWCAWLYSGAAFALARLCDVAW
jgi:hypothetical protein